MTQMRGEMGHEIPLLSSYGVWEFIESYPMYTMEIRRILEDSLHFHTAACHIVGEGVCCKQESC